METVGQLRHKVDKLTHDICKAQHALSVAKSTTKYANLRQCLLVLCYTLDRQVPYMQNRERVLRHAPEIIDDAKVLCAALEHELRERRMLRMVEADVKQELKQSYRPSPIVIACGIVAVALVILGITGVI